ncbi:MAG: DUF1508 domain-containing protein [Spirochaetia bacterium]
MKQEYDFSQAEQGKFYRGERPYQVVVNVSSGTEHTRYEVFHESESGRYRFRLRSDSTVLFTSDTTYASKDECLEAIAAMRHASVIAPTVFAS